MRSGLNHRSIGGSWFAGWTALLVSSVIALAGPAPIPVLKRSDVVFMYEAPGEIYEAYGATMLAWGGAPRAKSAEQTAGLKYFGSVGMVTEFSRYCDRFPSNYQEGLCRDLKGQPFKVPWLRDHQHKGIPYWWCCTRQPLFRQYISERVVETVKAGVNGVHIDDHLGTAGALFVDGGCFCGRCVSEFRDYVRLLPAEELSDMGVKDPGTFDFAQTARTWIAEKPGRRATGHPLWNRWRAYQLRGAATFMGELRKLAARTAGKPVPMGANAGLMWGPHLNDYQVLDLFSAEVEHHAWRKVINDEPVAAYRIAEAVKRPLAATASGQDWAFILENRMHGLVQSWIALGYAAGNCLMAPNRQWCYTEQKGTHWYAGPQEKFAPLYRFVRQNALLFDDYETHADLILAYAQRTFDRDRGRFAGVCHRLTAANISFRLALGGDEVVNHPLSAEDFRGTAPVVVLQLSDFQDPDKTLLSSLPEGRKLDNAVSALDQVLPAVRVARGGELRVFPRVKSGAAVIHVVNWKYDPARDSVEPARNVVLNVNAKALGVSNAKQARLFAPDKEASAVGIRDGALVIPEVGLWTIVEMRSD